MNPLDEDRNGRTASAPTSASESDPALDDPRVAQALREYQAALKAGRRPERRHFLASHADIAEALAECLDGLELLQAAAPALRESASNPPVSADAFQPEGPLGDYRIVREIGRGGMGIVYEAVQTSLGRSVALKVLPFAAALDPRQLQRFKNEAQAAAHLHHTHIVPVFGVGCERGIHYYAMQFIAGQTLAALIRELRQQAGKEKCGSKTPVDGTTVEERGPANVTRPIAPRSSFLDPAQAAFFRTVATLGVQAAEALEHAHQQGVVHRDIKPANLLIDGAGNLWITDFGLARLQGDTGLTMSGDLLGTVRYMSPEQALGKGTVVDPRTDIYSLGVTLYELLTLEPAHNGRDRQEVLRQIAEDEPIPLRALNKAIPAELETIVLKALSKAGDERYASAQELADDLRRFLEDKPIRARRPSLRQRAAKWARRHKTVVRAALVVLLLAVVGLAVSTVFIWEAKEDLKQALERERQNAYYQRIALAEREWSANNLNRMLQLLDECPPDLRGWEWHYLQRLRVKTLPPLRHDSAVFCAVFSPDGERIATASQDGHVTIWDARCGRQLFQFRAHDKHARSVAFSPDGRLLATCSWDRTVKIWDISTFAPGRTPSPLRTMRHRGTVYSVLFSPDGKRLATAGGRRALAETPEVELAETKVWDPISGQEVCTLEGAERETWSALAFSPDGQSLVTGHRLPQIGFSGNIVYVWDANTGRKRCTLRGHTQPVTSVAFSPDGRFVASGAGKPRDFVGTDGELKLWDVEHGREILDMRAHITVFAVAFSPDGRRLFSAGEDQTIKLWDMDTGKEVLTLRGHFGTVRSLAFSPDGRRLVSAGHDATVRVWDATPLNGQTDAACLTLRGHRGDVTSIAFHPDGRCLASASLDQTIKLWDFRTGNELFTLPGHRSAVLYLAFSPDGRFLASGESRDRNVKLWDATTWQVIRTFPQPRFNTLNAGVAFSPRDGKLLAVASTAENTGQVVAVWDTETGHVRHHLHGHTWNIQGVAFDPAGRFVASTGNTGMVLVWDLCAGGGPVTLRPKHDGNGYSVAFSPDGKYLVSASMDRTVRVWNSGTWELLRTLPDALGGIRSVAFAPDSRRLAWGGTDTTVKVADPTTGQMLETLRGHTGWVNAVVFSPDGRQIASASADGTVKIWQAPPVAEPSGEDANDQDP
jgi:WD40 repeat protein/serine/threonine protein kinase